jgi:diguanylate cyclase (GGDEF)-like protein
MEHSTDEQNSELLSLSQLNHRIYDKLSRVMTGENILDELHAQLIHGIIGYISVQRVAFIKREENIFLIQAEEWSAGPVSADSPTRWDKSLNNWTEELISRMKNSAELIKLEHSAIRDLLGISADGFGVVYPKSILCLPVNHKEVNLGFLYLENYLTERAFEAEHLKLLQIIATQYALSLVLFEEAQKLIWQKSRELNQTRQSLYSAKLKLENLERLSAFDGLTGLYNRSSYERYLFKEWRRAIRETTPLSMILVDIDLFSHFNENYGFLVGDDCIAQIAAVINKTVKRPGDLAARYNGDRFCLILPNTDAKGAFFIAEQIRENVAGLAIQHAYSDIANHITVSAGVATVNPVPHDSLNDLTGQAEEALYMAKIAGRNRSCFNRKD